MLEASWLRSAEAERDTTARDKLLLARLACGAFIICDTSNTFGLLIPFWTMTTAWSMILSYDMPFVPEQPDRCVPCCLA